MVSELLPAWTHAAQVFVAVGLAVACASFMWEALRRLQRERRVARELQHIGHGGVTTSQGTPRQSLLLATDDAEAGALELLTRYLPRREDLRRLLDRADVDWGVGTFLLLTLGLTALALGGAALGLRRRTAL